MVCSQVKYSWGPLHIYLVLYIDIHSKKPGLQYDSLNASFKKKKSPEQPRTSPLHKENVFNQALPDISIGVGWSRDLMTWVRDSILSLNVMGGAGRGWVFLTLSGSNDCSSLSWVKNRCNHSWVYFESHLSWVCLCQAAEIYSSLTPLGNSLCRCFTWAAYWGHQNSLPLCLPFLKFH